MSKVGEELIQGMQNMLAYIRGEKPAERETVVPVLMRIVRVQPGARPLSLYVHWNTGSDSEIDISSVVNACQVYAPLRQSQELFQQVRGGDCGTDVVWTDDIDMSADTLWRLAQEQSGEAANG